MAQTIGQAAVTIPRNQSLSAFLVEVRDHNNDVLEPPVGAGRLPR